MRIALVLASGGARGYAHIGAIRELKRRGHEIAAISGTSMGALVGGLEAAGTLDAYEEWVRTLRQIDVARLLFDPAPGQPGMSRLRTLLQNVSRFLGGTRIEDLPIPFTAVAADLGWGTEVWFQRGPVDAAVRASMAIPGAFTPVVIDGRLLVDGGILNPVPLEPVLNARADATLAVTLDARPPGLPRLPEQLRTSHVGEQHRGTIVQGLRGEAGRIVDLPKRFLSRVTSSDGPTEEADRPEAAGADGVDGAVTGGEAFGGTAAGAAPDVPIWDQTIRGITTHEVMAMSYDTMQQLVTRYRMASNPPDATIRVPFDVCGTMDFHRAAEVIAVGETMTREELDRLGW